MHLVKTGRGQELRQIADVTACDVCGRPFEQRRYTTSWQQCSCTPDGRGHLVFICLRDPCRGQTYDPPCARRGDEQAPLEGHRTT